MRDRILGIKFVSVRKIVGFSGGNPKTPTDADREQLRSSLENHGYVIPVAVRDAGDGFHELIDGHQRVDVISQLLGPDEKIKVLVLDVETVADGRRILLALQRTTGFDFEKLEEFVVEMLADGATASEVMVDTGLTGENLAALAAAGQRALDEMTGVEPSRPAARDASEPAEAEDGDAPETELAVGMTKEQRKSVRAAMRLARKVGGATDDGTALEIVALAYSQANGKPRARRDG